MSSSNSESTSNLEDQKVPDVIPVEPDMDRGYAWVIVASAFLVTFSSWGLNASFGIYFSEYLNNDVFPGGSKAHYAMVGGISMGLGLVCAPIVNFIQGLVGIHMTMLLGNLLQLAAMILASFATKLWQLYLTQGLLQSLGLAIFSLPSLTLVSQWFVKRRVLANAISVTGSGAGGLTFTLGMQKIIDTHGYRWALRAQGIISFVLAIVAIALVKERNKHHKVQFTFYDMDCLRCVGFWILSFYLITCMFGYVIVMFSLADYTTSLGYTASQGAIVSSMVQVSFCFARALAGLISDKVGPTTVASFCYYMAGIFCLGLWIPAANYASAIALALILGIFMGAVFPTIASITARLVGISKLNVCFCMSWAFFGVAALFSQLIGVSLTSNSTVVDPKEYRNTAAFAGASFIACATAALLLRGYILARDVVLEAAPEGTNMLHVRVPPREVFRSCFKWAKKRA